MSGDEKRSIERSTAEGFLRLYNNEEKTDFSIVDHGDSPDILCKNSDGENLGLEITLTQDRDMDIAALLGRSNHRSLETLREHNRKVDKGEEYPKASCLQGNVFDQLMKTIEAKLLKDYGANVALVVRDSSPVDWDWESIIDRLSEELGQKRNPFDKGIWLLNFDQTNFRRIV
jgi:hypothetical protein